MGAGGHLRAAGGYSGRQLEKIYENLDLDFAAHERAAEKAPRHFDLTCDTMPEQPALARFCERIIT